MNPDPFSIINAFPVWQVVKIMVLFLLLMYIVFAFVVLKQVNLMLSTIPVTKVPLRLVAVFHLILAISVFVLALLVL